MFLKIHNKKSKLNLNKTGHRKGNSIEYMFEI